MHSISIYVCIVAEIGNLSCSLIQDIIFDKCLIASFLKYEQIMDRTIIILIHVCPYQLMYSIHFICMNSFKNKIT